MDNLRDITPETGTGMETDAEKELGFYHLERELGRGFSSVVYEATDTRRPRVVALKVLTFLQTLSADRRVDLAERFRREAQAVSALSHPNIVAIYEVGQAGDGRQFIAMECLPGETLRQRLRRSSPMSVPEAVAIAVRVADALHYAHGRGIVHRDVKPDNIFLAETDGPDVTPKLMDFGIAHVLSDQALTQDGTIVGSPAYMSPEQINGQSLDARTDIFSLAVTLCEMVTGAKPFEGDSIPAVMQQILKVAPDLRAVPGRRLERILSRALSKNPVARYPDAGAFADALRSAAPLAAAEASVATQIIATAPTLPAFRTRRRRALLGTAGAGVLALAALAALPLVSGRPPVSIGAASPAPLSPPAPAPGQVSLLAAPVRQALGAEPRRHEITSVWHPVRPHHVRLARRVEAAPTVGIVRIAEETPTRRVSPTLVQPYYAPPARIPSVTQPPKPAMVQTRTTNAPPPVVRVAGVRQELTSANSSSPETIPETEPRLDAEQGLNAPAPARPPASAGPAASADAPPRPLRCPMPPAVAALDAADASVRLRLSVDEDGDVSEATILTSSGDRALDDAALEAVGHWEYAPAVKDGHKVAATVAETVKFSRR